MVVRGHSHNHALQQDIHFNYHKSQHMEQVLTSTIASLQLPVCSRLTAESPTTSMLSYGIQLCQLELCRTTRRLVLIQYNRALVTV
jgi:hypothetical protein